MDIRYTQVTLLLCLFGRFCEGPLNSKQNYHENQVQYSNLLRMIIGNTTLSTNGDIITEYFKNSDIRHSKIAQDNTLSSRMSRHVNCSKRSKRREKIIKQKRAACLLQPQYRTADGSCNNLHHPNWGKTNIAYKRMLPPRYSNDAGGISLGKSGNELPNPRLISRILNGDELQSSIGSFAVTNALFVHWGQFLCHDIAFTPIFQRSGTGNCCKSKNPECIPLVVNFQDPFYNKGDCMDFPRSDFICKKNRECLVKRTREQINVLSSYIDASNIYDITNRNMKLLREDNGKGAKLKSHKDIFEMPILEKPGICSSSTHKCRKCPLLGDRRSIATPVLITIHTLWIREHNRLVDLLQHKGWEEEKLFQEVRKIIGALMQHVAYSEYLPLLLGNSNIEKYNLKLSSNNNSYDSKIDATVSNVVAAAALRYGHSMLTRRVARASLSLTKSPRLSEDFFSVDDFCPNAKNDPVVEILMGQIQQYSATIDHVFTKEVTNFLFPQSSDSQGFDIFAIDIMRGRDHGLPPYNDWRVRCHLSRIKSYEQLKEILQPGTTEKIKEIYGTNGFDDIDLFVGGISERPVSGALLGPTFTCIIAEQFRRLKAGDRFWYENLGQISSFTKAQIQEIRKTTLASLICRNTKLTSIQPMAFLPTRRTNQKMNCLEIVNNTDFDMRYW